MRLFLPVLSILSLLAASCTPADRATARAVVDLSTPLLCPTLAGLLGGSGLVCPDLQRVLDAALATAPAATPPPTSTPVASLPATSCTPLRLADVVPTRDPREYVCAERFGGEAAARVAVRRALDVGHAR